MVDEIPDFPETKRKKRKNRGANSKTSPQRIKALLREREALELKLAGHSYHYIADKMKMSLRGVRFCVERSMERARKENDVQAGVLRDRSMQRIAALRRAIWQPAIEGDLQAVDRAIKLEEREAKLLGLDAPSKVAPTDPTGEAAANLSVNAAVEVVTYRIPDNGRDPPAAEQQPESPPAVPAQADNA